MGTSTTVIRYDAGQFAGPIRLDNGYLRVDARLTRVGVFNYLTNDGIRRELRLPDEVFAQDAVDSFDMVPLTNEHPSEKGSAVKLDASNTRKFQVGTVTGLRRDGGFLASRIQITDKKTIEEAEKGKRELSAGYHCDLDMTPGVTSGIEGVPDGLRYDAVQRNIRGNHVALVTNGRAGPEASLRLDSGEGIMTDTNQNPSGGPADGQLGLPINHTTGVTPMKQIKVDGVDFEVSEQAAQAVQKVIARADEATEKLDATKADVEKQKARADKAEEELEAAKKLHADALSPERVKELVSSRLDLERSASKILGADKAKELKVDSLSDEELKKAVILHVSPAAAEKLEGADTSYVSARFDQAVESHKDEPKPNPALQAIRSANGSGNDRYDAEGARLRMLQDNFEIGRKPLKAQA